MKRDRPRQADSLTLSPAELMRIALEMRGIETDEPEELGDPFPASAAGRRACG